MIELILEIKNWFYLTNFWIQILFFHVFFLIIDLPFLIQAFITQIFDSTAELETPKGTTTKEGKAEFKTQPVKVEAKISKFSM